MMVKSGLEFFILKFTEPLQRYLLTCSRVTVQEEKLLYDSKDLLAWTGGALGIFVAYSIFDLSSQILDWVFQFVCRII
jgi:hypothetical protein